MKCVVPSQNVKILAKAFHSLGRIGDDLFIEPHRTHLAFRTVSMAESAYASFDFSKSFFSSFVFGEDDNEETLRCKIAMKSLLVVFKSQHGERLIEWCQLRIDPNGNKVVFQLRYSYGCTKTHLLPILESETLKASYSKEDCQNRLSALPKLLSTAVKNFRSTEDEVTLYLMHQKIILRNHLENNLDSKKAVKTEVSLSADEFESCNVRAPTSVTFCLKEFRAVLFFAEFTGLAVQLYISTAGKPVIFVINNDTLYEANYVVSTLNETGTSQPLSQTSESSAATSTKMTANAGNNLKKRSFAEMEAGKQPNTHVVHSGSRNLERNNGELLHDNTPQDLERGLTNADSVLLNGSAFNSETSQCAEPANLTKDSTITQPIVKSVFGRCFNATFQKQSVPGFEKVLVYDSDGMEDSD